jgi:hypothetical protein
MNHDNSVACLIIASRLRGAVRVCRTGEQGCFLVDTSEYELAHIRGAIARFSHCLAMRRESAHPLAYVVFHSAISAINVAQNDESKNHFRLQKFTLNKRAYFYCPVAGMSLPNLSRSL